MAEKAIPRRIQAAPVPGTTDVDDSGETGVDDGGEGGKPSLAAVLERTRGGNKTLETIALLLAEFHARLDGGGARDGEADERIALGEGEEPGLLPLLNEALDRSDDLLTTISVLAVKLRKHA